MEVALCELCQLIFSICYYASWDSFADTAIDQKLIFVPTLVTHGSPNGTSLQMLGNLSSNRVDAAAYRTTVNMAAGGNVSFEIQSANGDESLANHSVTSVVLWLGDAGTTTEYTVVSSPGKTGA